MKDWNGNGNSIYKTLGASNHTDKERAENDYYATDPIAIDKLLSVEKLSYMVWECACGAGHLSNKLREHHHMVLESDIIKRVKNSGLFAFYNFLTITKTQLHIDDFDIVTNPPYKYAKEFVLKALDLVDDGHKVCMFLKLTFLEGKARYKELFSKYPPKKIWVFSERVMCAKNGDFDGMRTGGGSAVAYAWFIWEKGYHGETIIGWI